MTRMIIRLMLILGVACSKGGSGSPSGGGTLPVARIADVIQERQASGGKFRFYVDLSGTYSQPVQVSFTTVDGSAKTGTDFLAASGTLTIPAGQTEVYMDIQVNGDSLRKANQQFYVQLSQPVNCTFGTGKATGTIVNENGPWLPTDNNGYVTPLSYPGLQLAWHDEFDGNALNAANWNYETGGNGWGNHELENYTSRTQNVFVSAGNLVIEARQESYGGSNYTSARINTLGKQGFQFARIDIRAKLPVLKGMWPALWMLGSNFPTAGWPGCGEIDIMELIGTNPSQVVGSLHWKKQDGSAGTINNAYALPSGDDFSRQFHVFSLNWVKDSVQFLVDDHIYVKGAASQITDGTYPFNNPFFFIFNVAVGGDWPGPPDGTTVFPQRMFVDYVRVFN